MLSSFQLAVFQMTGEFVDQIFPARKEISKFVFMVLINTTGAQQ
jgi:hypothetical protein